MTDDVVFAPFFLRLLAGLLQETSVIPWLALCVCLSLGLKIAQKPCYSMVFGPKKAQKSPKALL